MRRTLGLTLCIVAAAALFAGLVHIVLVAMHLSEPAANTVHGFTIRRLWATAAALLALMAAVGGGLSVARASARSNANSNRRFAVSALIAGSVAAAAGWLNLAYARGGPGTGNGVVGGAAAFVLGIIAVALGAITLSRFRRAALNPRQTT